MEDWSPTKWGCVIGAALVVLIGFGTVAKVVFFATDTAVGVGER